MSEDSDKWEALRASQKALPRCTGCGERLSEGRYITGDVMCGDCQRAEERAEAASRAFHQRRAAARRRARGDLNLAVSTEDLRKWLMVHVFPVIFPPNTDKDK